MKLTLNLKEHPLNEFISIPGRVIGGDYGPNGGLSYVLPDKNIIIKFNGDSIYHSNGLMFAGWIEPEYIEYDVDLVLDTWISWLNKETRPVFPKVKAKYYDVEGFIYLDDKTMRLSDEIQNEIRKYQGQLRIGDKINLKPLYFIYDSKEFLK
jgi:hypothetical protein